MLLADRRRQAPLGAEEEEKGNVEQQHRDHQRRVGGMDEGEKDVEPSGDGAEEDHESPVPHAERIEPVAGKPEGEREVDRDVRNELKGGEFVRLQVQLVLQKEAYRQADQAAAGRGEA